MCTYREARKVTHNLHLYKNTHAQKIAICTNYYGRTTLYVLLQKDKCRAGLFQWLYFYTHYSVKFWFLNEMNVKHLFYFLETGYKITLQM